MLIADDMRVIMIKNLPSGETTRIDVRTETGTADFETENGSCEALLAAATQLATDNLVERLEYHYKKTRDTTDDDTAVHLQLFGLLKMDVSPKYDYRMGTIGVHVVITQNYAILGRRV